MNKMNTMMVVVALLVVGCSHNGEVKTPASPCSQCYTNIKEGGKDTAATAGVMAADIMLKTLEYLQGMERAVQAQIEEWKVNHPEFVERGEKELESIRETIREYKESMIDTARGWVK